MNTNTLLLRLEGPLQAWGDHQSKFVVRRTGEAPTKSGVLGLLCAALGVPRPEAATTHLPQLGSLRMGVRIDRPGIRWWDYHTVGADMPMRTAEGKSKSGAMLTRREYLCDASFLVALQGEPGLIAELAHALAHPRWTLYLGRKCCPPGVPLLARPGEHDTWTNPLGGEDLLATLASIPWRPRLKGDTPPEAVECLCDWSPSPAEPEAPEDAEVWYDVPLTFEPPSHAARFVIRSQLQVGKEGFMRADEQPTQSNTPAPPRPRADYGNTAYRRLRLQRLERDQHLCVFCKAPATTVQHITYRHAGGSEQLDELRSLCRLCHDAVTMLEYGLGMGMDRINPEEERWRDAIICKRDEVVRFRSLETRRRRLEPEEVE